MVRNFLKDWHDQLKYFIAFRIILRFIFYPFIHYYSKSVNLKFINLGCLPNLEEKSKFNQVISHNYARIADKFFPLEDHLPHLYLYEKTLSMCPLYPTLDSLVILEAGCGLGNGLQWVQCAHPEIKRIDGIDRCVSNDLDGLITYSNVHDMQKPSNSVDLILNVESSHLYDDIRKFLQEVERVLKPGGYFCWCDIAYSKKSFNNKYILSALNTYLKINNLLKTAEEINLELVSYEDITEPVLMGIDQTSKRYDKMLDSIPWYLKMWKYLIRNIYFAPHTEVNQFLRNGEMLYAVGCWKKTK